VRLLLALRFHRRAARTLRAASSAVPPLAGCLATRLCLCVMCAAAAAVGLGATWAPSFATFEDALAATLALVVRNDSRARHTGEVLPRPGFPLQSV
jgi:hypothetical protein